MAEKEHDAPDARERGVTPGSPADAKGSPEGPHGRSQVSSSGTPLTQQVGRIVLTVAAILFGVFAVVNFQNVEVDWLFTTVEIPLFVALIVSFALGALSAWIATVRSERRKRRGPTD